MGKSSRDRPIQSCARCYQMKKKCDKKVPVCTRCEQAKKPCLGINRVEKTQIPRSVASYLERQVAALESKISWSRGHPSASIVQQTENQASNLPLVVDGTYDAVIVATNEAVGSVCTNVLLSHRQDVPYAAELYYGSERPPLKVPVHGVYNELPPRSASQVPHTRLAAIGAARIPRKVAKTLLANYRSNMLAKHPCFREEDLVYHFDAFYALSAGQERSLPDVTVFIVSMIMGISTLTSKAADFRRVALLSESLHHDAMARSSFLRSTSFRSLQCMVLLIQMALYLPYTSNLWYLSGEAMRMAIALGLHEEPDGALDAQTTRLRRSLFWTVYQLERTVCIASGCPVSIADAHISTRFISDIHLDFNEPMLECHADKKSSQFLRSVQLSRIQSEIHGVQFFDQDLPRDALDYSDWIQKMEAIIQNWENQPGRDGDSPVWVNNAGSYCRLLLYRPCSRNMIPSADRLRKASTAAVEVLKGYSERFAGGKLTSNFSDVFDVFQAGMILLYATCRPHDLYSIDEANIGIELLGPLFDALSTRWPAATDTKHYILGLRTAAVEDLNDRTANQPAPGDIDFLAELDFMVTQRRLHSIYHRNVDLSSGEAAVYTDPSNMYMDFPDDIWQQFVDTDFAFLTETPFLQSDSWSEQSWNQRTAENQIIPNAGSSIELQGTTMDLVDTDMQPVELDGMLESLPGCDFCRSQHIRCDRDFPLCGACARSSRECVYYDQVLQQSVSRSHIHRLTCSLRAAANEETSAVHARSPLMAQTTSRTHVLLPFTSKLSEGAVQNFAIVASNPDRSLDAWFFGKISCVTLMGRLSLPIDRWDHLPPHRPLELVLDSAQTACCDSIPVYLPRYETSSILFRKFSVSLNVLYPTIKSEQLEKVLTDAYNGADQSNGEHGRRLFYIIMTAASHTIKYSSNTAILPGKVYLDEALRGIDTSDHSWLPADLLDLLQQTLLICIYLLISPASGDLWRYLGFAIRLYFDLSHSPTEGVDQELLCMLSRTLYCLESQVSIAFGRPSLLVIGDKPRSNMLRPMTTSVEEYLSTYFYRISLLKMQIHNDILAQKDASMEPMVHHQSALDAWLVEWRSDIADLLSVSHQQTGVDGQYQAWLEAWANLHYRHAALLAGNAFTSAATPESTSHCEELIKACNTLLRHQQRSRNIQQLNLSQIILVPDWTLAHLIFSVGLHIATVEKPTGAVSGMQRRCITLLALLEGDSQNLSTGFSEILERLYSAAP